MVRHFEGVRASVPCEGGRLVQPEVAVDVAPKENAKISLLDGARGTCNHTEGYYIHIKGSPLHLELLIQINPHVRQRVGYEGSEMYVTAQLSPI